MQSSSAVVVREAHRPQAAAVVVEQVVILLVGLMFQTQSQLELAVLVLQLLRLVTTATHQFMEWLWLAVARVDKMLHKAVGQVVQLRQHLLVLQPFLTQALLQRV
jgi:hypothetical protein